MTNATLDRCLIVFFRLAMGWTFLYAASHQVFDPQFTVVGFLNHTKTFHNLFAVFTTPTMAPITTFLVEYGHLLIGLSLVLGLMVRVSASFGVLLMLLVRFFIMRSTRLVVDVEAKWIIISLVVGLIGGSIGALYPAMRAARQDAVDALSYE